MVSCDGILELLKEAASKRIEQILLAEWREKKDFYQREGQRRDELLGRLNDVEKQLFDTFNADQYRVYKKRGTVIHAYLSV